MGAESTVDSISGTRAPSNDGPIDGPRIVEAAGRLSRSPGKLSEVVPQEDEGGYAAAGRTSSLSASSNILSAADIPDHIAREFFRTAMKAARELKAVWDEVGGYSESAKIRVVDQLLGAVREACDASVLRERETRGGLVAHIEDAKAEMLDLSRKLGCPLPMDEEGNSEGGGDGGGERRESAEAFFYGKEEVSTLTDRLATLEVTLDGLRQKHAERKEVVDRLLEEMETTNRNMNREPEVDEMEGGLWDLSLGRIKRLEARAATLRTLKEERAQQMVSLLVECQDLYRALKWEMTLPLDHQILGSLCGISEEPKLRMEELNPSCVGLSSFSLDRLNKKIADLNEEKEHRTLKMKEQRQEVEALWDKLQVPQGYRDAHTAGTSGISYADMERMEAELLRLKKAKAEKLHDMMRSVRSAISSMLAGMGATAEEVFCEEASELEVPMEDWNEQLLEVHEDFLATMHGMQERVKKIMSKVETRETLVQMREKLALSKTNFSARRTGVQSQAREMDKMRKKVADLPRVTDALRKMLRDWQDREGFPFRFNGRKYLDVIEESDAKWQHKREEAKRVKKYGMDSPMASPQQARRVFSGSMESPRPASSTMSAIIGGTFHSVDNAVLRGGRYASTHPAMLGASITLSHGDSPSTAVNRDHFRTASGDSSSGSSGSGGVGAYGGGGMTDRRLHPGDRTVGPKGGVFNSRAGGGGAGGGENGVSSQSLPSTPQKEMSNPLLGRFTPPVAPQASSGSSPFSSAGGPPPPLPMRPLSGTFFQRLQCSPGIQQQATTGGVNGSMPPPLPDRPGGAAMASSELGIIREASVGSIIFTTKSKVSASVHY